jgi:hypothetical protein
MALKGIFKPNICGTIIQIIVGFYLFIRMTLYKKMFMGGHVLGTPVFLVARSPFSSHPGPFVLQQNVVAQIEIFYLFI